MTRAQILSSVVELSGRHDLDDTMVSGTTKGQFFLDAALKLLDTKQRNPESRRWLMKDCAEGDYQLTFQNCRSIQEVWMANADGRFQLEKKALGWIKENYSDPTDELDTGQPAYYAVDAIHISPQQKSLTAVGGTNPYTDDFTYDYHNIMFGDSYGYNAVVWMAPADGVYTVEVFGDWYSVMTADDDKCYWSIVYPNVLVQAVLFAIEVFYRNTAGMKDALGSLQPFLDGIDHDLVQEESVGINQMEG